MLYRFVALAGLLAALPVAASARITPSTIIAQVNATGARASVAALVARHRWNRVLGHIGTGKAPWLEVAAPLSAGTDASQSLGLTIALATALPRNAAGVLAVASRATGPLGIANVCSAPFIEPVASDLAYYRSSAKRAVERVTAPGLRAARRACLAALHAG